MKPVLLLVAAAAILGCGDDTTSVTQDLATVSDFAVATDLSTLSCGSVLACVVGCGQNVACQSSCRDEGSTAARALYDAFEACLVLTCAPVDGGTRSCTSPTDNSAGCRACLANVSVQAMSPGGPCNSEYAACFSH